MAEGDVARLDALLATLRDLQFDLRQIAERQDPASRAFELLAAWDVHARTILTNEGLARDAQLLSDLASREFDLASARLIDKHLGTLRRWVGDRDSLLSTLLEDLETHREFWVGRLSRSRRKPTVPTSGASAREPLPELSPAPPSVVVAHGRNPLWAKVQRHLKDQFNLEVRAWEPEPRAGLYHLELMLDLLDACSFAVVVITADDVMAHGGPGARQHVVHGIGLFHGRLGFRKVAIIQEEGIEELTHLGRLQRVRFSHNEIEESFFELDRMLEREGIVHAVTG